MLSGQRCELALLCPVASPILDTESKAKNIALDESDANYDMMGRLDADVPRPRVNSEGELTDSFVEEARRGRQDRR